MRNRRVIRIVLYTIIFIIPTSIFAEVTAIKAGRLVNPENGAVQNDAVILVEGIKIKAVGSGIKIPKGAKTIDLSDLTVLPGLMDCHTHLCNTFDTKGDVGATLLLYNLTVTTAERAMQGVVNARTMLESGFTCVRDMGNAGNYADVALRKAIDNGWVPGPKFYVSGKILAPFGGQYHLDPEFPDLGKQDYIYADTKDEMKKGIRQNIHFGVDWIKIIVDDYAYIYSTDDIRYIIEESAKAGLYVAAHCATEKGARNAIEAGLVSIEHGFEMSDETLMLAKQRGAMLVATDFTQELMDLYQFFDTDRADIIDRLKRAYKIGIPLVYGSDVVALMPGHTRGSASLSLIDSWVDADIPAKIILQALTTNAARLLGIENERGLIKQGMMADIIATPENPLDNVQTLKRVKFVMKEGKIYRSYPD